MEAGLIWGRRGPPIGDNLLLGPGRQAAGSVWEQKPSSRGIGTSLCTGCGRP